MTSALTVYERGLETGLLRYDDGRPVPVDRWLRDADTSDLPLLDHCTGPTLDVGCGPGRLTAALVRRGVPALGIDLSDRAVSMTIDRGGLALRRDVFTPTPGERRWQHILLADGNIGIGADPVRLLARCAELLAPGGSLLLDLDPPGYGLVTATTRVHAAGISSRPFRWSRLGVDVVTAVSAPAGLLPQQVWRSGDRWQACLVLVDGWAAPGTTAPRSSALRSAASRSAVPRRAA